ncbi:piggyBac transposable element-derived protein 1-like isoform X2 [Bactrocera dorsalis]|nr:piggyBac transposable element-derived protein 1-like isoform X2 [Bactrocera dorsalis]
MRPKGLTQAEIEKFANFDWDDSADEENEEEEDRNMEEIIEETLKNLDNRAENVEVGLIDQFIRSENDGDLNENENVVQEVMEKIDLKSLKWRSAEIMESETTWKSELCSNEVKTPIEYFSTFFTDELWQKICEETNLYAIQTKGIELKCTVPEMKRFVGILLYLAVVKIPTYRMAWAANFKLAAVENALPRNRFEKIKQFFHLNDNSKQPQRGTPEYDKLYKVRPLLDAIKKEFNEISQEEFQSIDEQMIAYKGQHNLKQYLPMKPHKWGFKMFTRAGVSGIIYDFTLYIGEGTCKTYGLGISSDIVLFLSSNLPVNQNFKLFFDNWFSSISLMIALKEKGILAVGTIRSNRLKNCALISEKDLQKRGRGSSDFKYEATHNLIACRPSKFNTT